MRDENAQYSAIAIILHWAIAVALLGNIMLGWWMGDAIDATGSKARAIAAFQLHKSIGLTVLLLSLLRLGWRMAHRPPALPTSMTAWEQLAARITHWLFYALMIGLPFSGWLYVSTQWRGDAALSVPTLWFGVMEVPHLFGLHEAASELRQSLSRLLLDGHLLLAWATGLLLILHVGAALKHHLKDGDDVLRRMVPMLRSDDQDSAPEPVARRWSLRAGMGLTTIGALACLYTLIGPTGTPSITPSEGGDIRSLSPEWQLDSQQSRIVFSGSHAGDVFEGRFERWEVELQIDQDALESSIVSARIETASARDGDPLHEKTLPEREWFDTENFPYARFASTRVRRIDDRYQMDGTLTIKDRPIPVQGLSLRLDGDQLVIEGSTTLSRADADLGMESDPDGDWVSRDIDVQVRVVATALR